MGTTFPYPSSISCLKTPWQALMHSLTLTRNYPPSDPLTDTKPQPSSLPNQPWPTTTVFSLLSSRGFSSSLLPAHIGFQTDTPDTPSLPSNLVTGPQGSAHWWVGRGQISLQYLSPPKEIWSHWRFAAPTTPIIVIWFPNSHCHIWHYRTHSTGFLIMPHSPIPKFWEDFYLCFLSPCPPYFALHLAHKKNKQMNPPNEVP